MTSIRKLGGLLLPCMALLAAISAIASAGEDSFSTAPITHHGKKWRIAYYEGGPYLEYQEGLSETIRGLMKLGWIEAAELPQQPPEETATLWRWLSEEARSDHLEFVKDAHYSSDWDEGTRETTVGSIVTRLNETRDIDLVMAMGTWAGIDLANSKHQVPTLVFSSSDPVAAGIIKSPEDSGLEHVHAAVDPSLYDRQLRMFHRIVGFRTLGVAYENSVDGRSYAAMNVVERAADELGFEVVRCHTISDIGNVESEAASVRKCFHDLAPKVDAIYVTQQGGIRLANVPDLVDIANEYRVPTFSQAGTEEVKYGFLASLSQASSGYQGKFNAKNIARVLNGASPAQLNQIFAPPPKVAINLKTAEIVGLYLFADILAVADHVFEDIEKPE